MQHQIHCFVEKIEIESWSFNKKNYSVLVASTNCISSESLAFSLQLFDIRVLVHGFLHGRLSSLSLLHGVFPLTSATKFSLLLHINHLTIHNQSHHQNLTQTICSSLLLRSCTDLRTLKQAHARILCDGFEPISISPKLITLYTVFDDLRSAVLVFKGLPERNTFTWNLIMKAHVDSGAFDCALCLYQEMRESGVPHDSFTFPVINRAISSLGSSLEYGEMVHGLAFQMGFGSDLYFCNTLIELYVKHGFICSARQVFDEMSHRDVVSWTSIISGYVWSRNYGDAFMLFHDMRMKEFGPNSVTVLIMVQACSISRNPVGGMQLHGYVIKRGFESNVSVQNSILAMYSNAGNLEDAEILFGKMAKRDAISWNIMISGYILTEDSTRVGENFNRMRNEAVPSLETLTLVTSAFAKSGNLIQGEKIHGYALKSGLYDVVLQTSLVDFYAKCGELGMSAQMFNETCKRNTITWSAMISGFVQNGYFEEAIELFQQMQFAGLKPGANMLGFLVLAYAHLGALLLGKGVHGYVAKNMVYSPEESNKAMETSILNMYAKCGSIVLARRCFDQMVDKDVVAWSSMIEAYGIHGLGYEALELFGQMEKEGVKPNNITFLSLLSSCGHSGLVTEGCRVFSYMSQRYNIKPDINHYTCIVDLLGRSGKIREALVIIEKMVVKPDSRIWGALLAASRVYSDSKLSTYAAGRILELEPDSVGYHTLLSNVHASVESWAEVETLRMVMYEKHLKKKPGWSCIQARGNIRGFVAGDLSLAQVLTN